MLALAASCWKEGGLSIAVLELFEINCGLLSCVYKVLLLAAVLFTA